MQAEFGDDALHTAGAEPVATLPELLGQDRGGSVGIEKAVPNDLLADLVRAAGGAFGAALLALQGAGPLLLVELAQLEVALLAEAEFVGGGQRAGGFAFAFVEHG